VGRISDGVVPPTTREAPTRRGERRLEVCEAPETRDPGSKSSGIETPPGSMARNDRVHGWLAAPAVWAGIRERLLPRGSPCLARAKRGGIECHVLALGHDAKGIASLQKEARDVNSVLDSPPVPWPLFVTLLLANGWFLRPVPFDQRPGRDTVPQRQRNAMLRIPLFVAAWIAARLLLPMGVVALAFAAWVAKVVPGIRRVNQRFQNVGPDEEPA